MEFILIINALFVLNNIIIFKLKMKIYTFLVKIQK